MIIYHPFRDANHCSYRIISLLYKNENKVNEEHLDFMDFYYLFPDQLKNIDNWPRSNSKLAVKIQSIARSYENIDNPRRIFFELNIIRTNTLAHLFSKGILSIEEGYICLNAKKLPEPLVHCLENDNFRLDFVFSILANEIPKLSIKGNKGLKAKTNLMEYRYD